MDTDSFLTRCPSTNSSVRPCVVRAVSNTRFKSATPLNTADIATNDRPAASDSKRAIVVFPTPGGPQSIRDAKLPRSIITVRRPQGPTKCG